jgi:hypothetical protein
MKKDLLLRILLVCFLLTLGYSALGEPANRGPKDLLLRLSLHKESFSLYEPVVLQYALRNPTKEEIMADVIVRPDGGCLKIEIAGPDGEKRPYGIRTHNLIFGPTIQPPEKEKKDEIQLLWNRNTRALAFPEPGKYAIHARMLVQRRPSAVYVEAEPIEVEIVSPREEDLAAIAYFESAEAMLKLLENGPLEYCGERLDAICLEKLRAFVQAHRESAYAPQVLRLLMGFVSSGLFEVPARVDLAVEFGDEFLDRWPTHPEAPDVAGALVMILADARRFSEAAERFQAFEQRWPEREAMIKSMRDNFPQITESEGE